MRRRPGSTYARGALNFGNPLVASADVPEDTSGLPPRDRNALWVNGYRADLALGDFICGARFRHHPLWFEDPYLERYGQTASPILRRVPAIHSANHMAWKSVTLPVGIVLDPPWQWHASGFREPYYLRKVRRDGGEVPIQTAIDLPHEGLTLDRYHRTTGRTSDVLNIARIQFNEDPVGRSDRPTRLAIKRNLFSDRKLLWDPF